MAKSAKEASLVATAASDVDKPADVKEKKSLSSKVGSIKLSPSALALFSSKPKTDDK